MTSKSTIVYLKTTKSHDKVDLITIISLTTNYPLAKKGDVIDNSNLVSQMQSYIKEKPHGNLNSCGIITRESTTTWGRTHAAQQTRTRRHRPARSLCTWELGKSFSYRDSSKPQSKQENSSNVLLFPKYDRLKQESKIQFPKW